MYIYNKKEWPSFSWNQEKIIPLLTQLRHKQGQLLGGMKWIGFQMQNEAFLKTLTQEAVKTSAIEGEILDPELVRSSVARHLGIETAASATIDRHVEGVVEMMLDATQEFEKPLSIKRLFQWHKMLFPSGRSGYAKIQTGCWRNSTVQVISGIDCELN